MPEITDPSWFYQMNGITSNRRTARTGVSPQFASRLVGIDGNFEGGLRPSTGFKQVLQLEYGYGTDEQLNTTGGLNAGGEMTENFPLFFRIGAEKYAWGCVYQVLSADKTKAVYRLKFRIGGESSYRTDYSLGFTKGLLDAPEDYNGEQFHVLAWGRFVYVFRSTKRPFVFYIDEPTPGTFSLIVETETGPGGQLKLFNQDKNSASAKITAGGGLTGGEDVDDILPTMTIPTDADASATVLYWGFSGAKQVSNDGINFFTNPFIQTRNKHSGGGSYPDSNLKGPSDTTLWATPPQTDPSFTKALLYTNGVLVTPVYSSPSEYEDVAWNLGARAEKEPMGYIATNGKLEVVWAYRLFDSRTGRVSPLSQRLRSSPDGFGEAAIAINTTNENGEIVTQAFSVSFPMFRMVYDKSRYDTLLLYRARPQTGLNDDELVLSLEATVTMADYLTDSQPGDTAWGEMAYFPMLSEKELSQQQTFLGDDTALEQMPYAGSAIGYEGTMLLGKMGPLEDSLGGLGKFMWSDLLSLSPELVPASNRYILQLPDEEINRFLTLGSNVLGLSKNTLYLTRREINYLKAQGMHEGYGCPGTRAACTVGSSVYYITEQGLHKIGQDGSLDSISVMDDIINNQWSADLSSVRMAFDAAASTVFVLNPEAEEMTALWINKGRMSEFVDCNFLTCMEGHIPMDMTDDNSRLQRRAVFTKYIQRMTAGEYRWALYVYDYNRSKTDVVFMDPTGPHVLTLSADWDGTTALFVDESLGDRLDGCYIYVLDGLHAGRKIKLLNKINSGSVNATIVGDPMTVTAGTKLGLSPTYFEWTGSLLGLNSSAGFQFGGTFDFHRTRFVDSINAVFSDVTWTSSDGTEYLKRYQAAIYSGNSVTAKDERFPQTINRDDVKSVEEGVSTYSASFSSPSDGEQDGRTGVQGNALFPAIRIFTPDLDFRLLAVGVRGSIRDEDAMRSRQ